MNFDDDLLGDILSDGSNDSFFDEPKITKKAPAKIAEKSDKLPVDTQSDDWLQTGPTHIETAESKKDTKQQKSDWLDLGKSDESTKPTDDVSSKIKKPVKKISFEDDDLIGNLGLNKKPSDKLKDEELVPKDELTKRRKSEFLESILGAKKLDDDIDVIKSRPKTAGEAETSSKDILESFSGTSLSREGRRKRVNSGLVDPLGLFSAKTRDELPQAKTAENTPSRTHSIGSAEVKDNISAKFNVEDTQVEKPQGLPDWLGGSSKLKSSATDLVVSYQNKEKSDPKADVVDNIKSIQFSDTNVGSEASHSQVNLLNSLLAHQKITESEMEYQNTAISLQQQESQILMALQMKKYEDNLIEIQRQQQDILTKQEQQFSILLERQFAKQHAMENNMKLQQERINNHIQLLLTQPRLDIPTSRLKEEVEKIRESAEEEHIKAYEHLIINLKERQREELFLLDESYKKQISLLEETTANTETRLRSELEALLLRSDENIKSIQEKHEIERDIFKNKIEEINEQHAKELKTIRDNHIRIIDEINYEHNLGIENIRESKRSESAILKDSGAFGQKLDANIQLLSNNSQILQNVSGRIETDYGVLYQAREETLKAKEKEIQMMRNALDKCRELAETERIQLLALVRNLETKMAEQQHAAKEDRWALQQAISILATRTAAFDRETEFTRASIEREREQLKALRESLLAEQEKVLLQLNEEKLTISAEKSRLETSNKLNIQFDSQKAKVELEAAIQVAKDAAEMTDRERQTLQKNICEVESLKRTLKDKEARLISNEMELAKLAQMAEQKSREGEKALQDGSMLQMRYNEKTKQLQFQLLQLSNREKRITEEKIALSKERISLNSQRRQKNCSLCAENGPETDAVKYDWNNDLKHPEQVQFPTIDVTEAEIFRLQFEDVEENVNKAFKDY